MILHVECRFCLLQKLEGQTPVPSVMGCFFILGWLYVFNSVHIHGPDKSPLSISDERRRKWTWIGLILYHDGTTSRLIDTDPFEPLGYTVIIVHSKQSSGHLTRNKQP